MDCNTAQMMLRRGEETQELLAHLAACPVCRARGEATELTRAPEHRRPSGDETEHVRLPRTRVYQLLPYIVGGFASLVIVGAVVVIVARTVGHEAPAAPKAVVSRASGGEAASGTKITIVCEPPAKLAVDGEARGTTPQTVGLDVGVHQIDLAAPGRLPHHGTFSVGGEKRTLHFTLDDEKGGSAVAAAEPAPEDNPKPGKIAATPKSDTSAMLAKAAKPEKSAKSATKTEAAPGSVTGDDPDEQPLKVAHAGTHSVEHGTREKSDDEGGGGSLVDGEDAPHVAQADDDGASSEGPPVGGGTGFVTILSEPWARVFIDGKDSGRSTPIVKMSLPSGKHRIELKAGDATASVDTTVVRGKERTIRKTLAAAGGGSDSTE